MTASKLAWQRVTLDIVRKIRSGATPVGSKIASVRKLSAEHKVSENTAKQAVKHLQAQGILKGEHGSGVFVIRVPDEEPTFAPAAPEDVAGRLGRVEENVSALREGHQDMREKIGALEATLRDLYSRTGHRYPGTRGQADQPRASRRKAADG